MGRGNSSHRTRLTTVKDADKGTEVAPRPLRTDLLTCDGLCAGTALLGIEVPKALDAVRVVILGGELLPSQGGLAARADKALLVPGLIPVGHSSLGEGLQQESTMLVTHRQRETAQPGCWHLNPPLCSGRSREFPVPAELDPVRAVRPHVPFCIECSEERTCSRNRGHSNNPSCLG